MREALSVKILLYFFLFLWLGFSFVKVPAFAQEQSERGQGDVNESQTGSDEEEGEQEEGEQQQEVVCSLDKEEAAQAFLRAQDYLRHLPAVQTRFIQYDAKGVRHEGLLRLFPPYRMRLDYDAPSGLRLYVNAREALHVDMKRKFVRQYPVLALPVVRMLQRIFSGKGSKTLQATRVCLLEGEYEVLRVRFRKKATRGYAELYFRKLPYLFLGWDLHDSGSGTTQIRFRGLEVLENPKVATFRFEAPWVVKRDER